MGLLAFLLIVALIAVTLLWREERSKNDALLADYGQRLLDDHRNLRTGLQELHDAEEQAIASMRANARRSNRR